MVSQVVWNEGDIDAVDATEAEPTVAGLVANMQEYELVLLLGKLDSLVVQQLPVHQRVGIVRDVRALAIASPVPQRRVIDRGHGGGSSGTSRSVFGTTRGGRSSKASRDRKLRGGHQPGGMLAKVYRGAIQRALQNNQRAGKHTMQRYLVSRLGGCGEMRESSREAKNLHRPRREVVLWWGSARGG